MIKIYLPKILLLFLCLFCFHFSSDAASYTWTGSVSEDWEHSANWEPVGIPDTDDDITINEPISGNYPKYEELPGVRNLTMNGGVLDCNGFIFLASGICIFNGGQVINGSMQLTGNSATFAGTVFNVVLTFTGNRFFLNGSTFNREATFTKTGSGSDNNLGGNTFNDRVTIRSTSSNQVRLAVNNPDTYNDDAYFINQGNGGIFVSRNAIGNNFNGDIIVSSTHNQGVRFGDAGGTSTIADGGTIYIGTEGFTQGWLYLFGITQEGSTPINLEGTVNATISIGNAEIGGPLSIRFPRILAQNSEFMNDVNFTKTGNSTVTANGGNTFHGDLEITKISNGWFSMANSIGDRYEGDVYVNDSTGTSGIQLATNSSNNLFLGNIYVRGSSSGGVRIATGANANAQLLNGTIVFNNNGLQQGELQVGKISQLSNEPFIITQSSGNGTITFQSGSIFNGPVQVSMPQIFLNGGRFNGPASFIKTGAGGNTSRGGNYFGDDVVFENQTNSNYIFGNVLADTFMADLNLKSAGSGIIYLSHASSGNLVQGQLTFENEGDGGVRLGQNNGTITLANGAQMAIGASGFSTGFLNIRGLTQVGTTAQNITQLSGTGQINFEQNNNFQGPITVRFPRFTVRNSTFQNNAIFEKRGTNDQVSAGGNTFQGEVTIHNNGTNRIVWGNTAPDVFGDDVTIISTENGRVEMCHSSSGNQFNADVILQSSGVGSGIYFCNGTNGSASIAPSGTIRETAPGISGGTIIIRNLTQQGTTPIVLNQNPGGNFQLNGGNTFNAPITIHGSAINLNNNIFNNTSQFTIETNANIACTGGNSFLGNLTLEKRGTGILYMANSQPDTYGADVNLVCSSNASAIYMSNASAGNTIGGRVRMTSTNGANGIRFGQSGGTTNFLPGSKLSIGVAGFSAGQLHLRNVAKQGASADTLILGGTTSRVVFGPNADFDGSFRASAPIVQLNGVDFEGTTHITQTGPTGSTSTGGNRFGNNSTIQVTGTGQLILANNNPDVFEGDATFTISGNTILYVAHATANNRFRGDVIFNSTVLGQGIRFCQGNANARAIMETGGRLQIGGTGLTAGSIRLRNFTQEGNTAQTLSNTTNAVQLYLEQGTRFNGPVTFSFRQFFLNGAEFLNTATLTQSGTSTTTSNGGNRFAANAILSTTGTGEWRLANTTADTYEGNLELRQSSSNKLFVSYGREVILHGNLSSVGSATAINPTSTGANARITFAGGANQVIDADAARPFSFRRMTVDKTNGTLTLNRPLSILTQLTLTAGQIVSSATNLLIFGDNATVTGASNTSFVDGPVRKIGNDAFTFPVGDDNMYRPIGISAPGSTTHHFTARYFRANSNGLYPHAQRAISLDMLSECEYWTLDRTSGTSNVVVNLSWDDNNSCEVYAPVDLQVARWDGAQWRDHGNGGIASLYDGGGMIRSSGAVTSFSPFTISAQTPDPLDIELKYFSAIKDENIVKTEWVSLSEINCSHYTVERSKDLQTFEAIATVKGAGNSTQEIKYELNDLNPLEGVSYYRLRQTDFNGDEEVFYPVSVYMESIKQDLDIFPNPFNEKLTLVIPRHLKSGNMRVVSLTGELVFQMKLQGMQSSVQELSGELFPTDGIYLVIIEGENEIITRKITYLK